ncbi:hypothetical protein ACS0TY_020892 [Phlomoides rotata]
MDLQNVDDLTLRRFLGARDLDVEKASAMYMKHLAWRRTIGGFKSNSTQQGFHARIGCPVLIVFGAKHFPDKRSIDELKRLVVFCLDKLCSRIPDGEEKFITIVDLKEVGYSNIDVRGYIAALSILQDNYPERLMKMFILHAPYIFMKAWKIVCPFIDKRINEKIIFVEKKKVRHTLMEEIEESQLPEIYGGKLQLFPIQDG